MGGIVDTVGDLVGGVANLVTDPTGSKAAKEEAKRARKQQEKLLQEQKKAEEETRKQRENMLRSATAPSQSLFQTLGSSQDKSTLG